MNSLEEKYGGDVHVHENTWPGLFGIITAMRALIAVMYALTETFILIVTIMTSGRVISAEQKDLGIYKAVEFNSIYLRVSFAARFGITAFIGAAVGIIFAAIFTDPLVSVVMRLAGISNFASSFSIESILPLVIVTVLFTAFAFLTSRNIRKTDLTLLITE